MKQKRRIKAIIRRLDAGSTEDHLLAKKVLEWVLDDGADFNDILPDIEEPQSKASLSMFAYDTPQEVWIMPDPFYEDKVYIESSRPSYMPPSWWTKGTLEQIEAEGKTLSFGDDPLRLQDSYKGKTISWVEVDNIFKHFRDMFRTRKTAEKYASNFFSIDKSDMVTVSATERREFQKENKVSPSELKVRIEEELSADWKYSYTENKEDMWALQKKTSKV